jgi:hypothetical protein
VCATAQRIAWRLTHTAAAAAQADGACAHLDVDVEDRGLAGCLHGAHGRDGSAVEVAMNLGVLQERAGGDLLLHGVARHKVVVHPFHLARPRRARGVADSEAKHAGMALHEPCDERALAHTRWPHNYHRPQARQLSRLGRRGRLAGTRGHRCCGGSCRRRLGRFQCPACRLWVVQAEQLC